MNNVLHSPHTVPMRFLCDPAQYQPVSVCDGEETTSDLCEGKVEFLNKIYIVFRSGRQLRYNHGSDSM